MVCGGGWGWGGVYLDHHLLDPLEPCQQQRNSVKNKIIVKHLQNSNTDEWIRNFVSL